MKIHEVKTNAEVFKDVWMERKLSEFRYDDRDYKIGDILIQKEWKPGLMKFTGRAVSAEISAITWISHWVNTDEPWCILHLNYKTLSKTKG